jgi:hypothetical protein
MVPAILAFDRGANARINRALQNTNGQCSLVPAQIDQSGLAANLNALCRAGATRTAAKQGEQAREKLERKQAPVPARQPTVPPPAQQQQSTSCSDITGTNSTAPAATNCKDAIEDRAVARVNRKKDPELSKYGYKKAAAAARRAGDTNLELSILREATSSDVAAVAAPNTVPQGSGAPPKEMGTASNAEPVSTSAPNSSTPHLWLPTKENPDCGSANELERQTTAYYYTCEQPNPPKSATGYRHPIAPQTLLTRAKQTCGSPSRDTYQCFVDTKVKILLAEDAAIRDYCLSKAAKAPNALRDQLRSQLGVIGDTGEAARKKALSECVDDAYVYGLKDRPTLRERLSDLLSKKSDANASERVAGSGRSVNTSSSPPTHCPPGQGMKPTPGAFGAWSCQLLGGVQDRGNANPRMTDSSGTPDPVQAFEVRVKEVAAAAVAAVADAAGAQLSAEDRSLCMEASYDAVLNLLKGGASQVPEKCRPMADAARAELAYYADANIDTSNPAVDELLSYLNMRDPISGGLKSGELGAPLPGFEGLKPSK